MNLTLLSLIVGILVLLTILVFGLYAGIAVRHATRFRYLSRRMLILTLTFVTTSIALVLALLMSYGFFLLK